MAEVDTVAELAAAQADTEWARLRAPFPPEQIGHLPRKTKTGGTIQLSYVGHAAVTDRLLQVDPLWTLEPLAFDEAGVPVIVRSGSDAVLWCRLTVCGHTRTCVGIAPANAFELEKQLISDAIRNGAMRFGVALDLWSRQDLHDAEDNAALPDPADDHDERRAALMARLKALPEPIRHDDSPHGLKAALKKVGVSSGSGIRRQLTAAQMDALAEVVDVWEERAATEPFEVCPPHRFVQRSIEPSDAHPSGEVWDECDVCGKSIPGDVLADLPTHCAVPECGAAFSDADWVGPKHEMRCDACGRVTGYVDGNWVEGALTVIEEE